LPSSCCTSSICYCLFLASLWKCTWLFLCNMHIASCLFDDVVFSTFDTIVREVLTVFIIVILSNCFIFTCFAAELSCATTNRVVKNCNSVAIYIISLFYTPFSIYISRFYAVEDVDVDITLITHTPRSTVWIRKNGKIS